jgi:hypothetical protein
VEDQIQIASERIQIERKAFFFDFKENSRGRFLRITEDVNGRRDTVVIPASGLENFKNVIEHIVALDKSNPSKITA